MHATAIADLEHEIAELQQKISDDTAKKIQAGVLGGPRG